MNCRLCSSPRIELLFVSDNVHGRRTLSDDQFGVYQCQSCGVVFVQVEVNSEYYRKYYPANYYEGDQGNLLLGKLLFLLKELSFKRKLRLINKYKPQSCKLLEIGCAKGEFLDRLPSSFQKCGVEINQVAYQYVKEHCKDIEIHNVRIDSSDFDNFSLGEYEVIVMWHVFEHVDNPKIFVRNLSRLLSKDGIVVLDIPNRNSIGFNLSKRAWFHLDAPRHLFHYTYDSLRLLLESYNLEIIDYSGNFADYSHDLAASFYTRLKGSTFFANALAAVATVPVAFAVRLLTALFLPAISEINTYVIKHKS